MKKPQRTDSEWIRELKQEDEAASHDLWLHLYNCSKISAYACKQSDDFGCDVAVSAYHKIIEKGVYQYKFKTPFLHYCRSIVAHEARNQLRYIIPREVPNPLPLEEELVGKEVKLLMAAPVEVRERLQKCMEELTRRLKEVIELLYFEELVPSQVAKKLEITQVTVNTRAHRARHNLKQCLQQYGYETTGDVLSA